MAEPVSGGATVISYAVLTAPFELPSNRTTLSPDNCGVMSAFGDVPLRHTHLHMPVTRLRA